MLAADDDNDFNVYDNVYDHDGATVSSSTAIACHECHNCGYFR
jgi:hypothetical protein